MMLGEDKTVLLGAALAFLLFSATADGVAAKENFYPHSIVAQPVITIWFDRQPENLLENYIPYERQKPAGIPSPPCVPYHYFEINVTGQALAVLDFRVEREWLEQHKIAGNGVKLLKFESSWVEVPVTVENVSDEHIFYSSDIFSFSIFVIGGIPEGWGGMEILVLLITIAVVGIGMVYFFLVRPKRLFVSMKKLRRVTRGGKIKEPPPGKEIAATIAHLKEKTEDLIRKKKKFRRR